VFILSEVRKVLLNVVYIFYNILQGEPFIYLLFFGVCSRWVRLCLYF